MFKSSNTTRTERGSPKQALLKKKARSTILSVLSKRQTQEKGFLTGKNQQERQSWSSDSTLSDSEVPKTHSKPAPKFPVEAPKPVYERSPRPVHQYSPRAVTKNSPKAGYEYSPTSPRLGTTRGVLETSPMSPQYIQTPEQQFEYERPQIARQTSFERKPQYAPSSPREIPRVSSSYGGTTSPGYAPKSPPKTAPKPIRSPPIPKEEIRSPLESGTDFIVKNSAGDAPPTANQPYSVIIQSTARYPPPTPQTSSADVKPYTVTVNSVRVYEATPKMVEDDPLIISRWARYPGRDPPVMSPTSEEEFSFDRMKTIEQVRRRASTEDVENRVVARSSVSSARTRSSSESLEVPKLISDSVQVSIPFGLRDVPPSPSPKESATSSWSSAVSVCVPFQVSEGEACKVPIEKLKAEEQVALEETQLSQLQSIAEEFHEEPVLPPAPATPLETGQQLSGSEPAISSAGSRKLSAEGEPRLVTIRRAPVEKEVQMPFKVDDTLLQGVPPGRQDKTDGAAVAKRGKYSVADQTRKDASHKSSSTRQVDKTKTGKTASPGSSPRQSRRGAPPTGVSAAAGRVTHKPAEKTQTKTSSKSVTTRSLLGKSKEDEVTMLKARIRQLEGEKEELQEKINSMEESIGSVAILEKEKMKLQSQLSDATQELDKYKQKLDAANEATKQAAAEKSIVQARHNKLLVELEKKRVAMERLEDEREVLKGEKNNLSNKTKRLQKEIDTCLEDVDRLTEENSKVVSENKELKNRFNDLLHGLNEVKKSVGKVRNENQLLHDEIVDNGAEMKSFMKKCVGGLEMVKERVNKELSTRKPTSEAVTSSRNDHVIRENKRLVEELEESKDHIEELLDKIDELEKIKEENDRALKSAEKVSFSRELDGYEGCPGCAKLREELNSLAEEYDSQKIHIEQLEVKIEDLHEERDDLQQESKYLKQVLSYREDMKSVQVSQKQTKQLQRLESNLEDAEKKCKDLESEVSQLYAQKQSLLMNILKQHEDDVAGQENEENEDHENESEEEEDESDLSEEDTTANVSPSPAFGDRSGSLSRTPRSSLKRGTCGGIYGKRSLSMESDFSSGTSFYDSSSSSESDSPSDLGESSEKLKDYVYGLKDELKHFKSSFKESNMERKSISKRLDKSSDDFKSMLKRVQKLDKENVELRDKVKSERKTYKAKIKQGEAEIDRLKESLRETEEEKQAVIRCMGMNTAQVEPEEEPEKRSESPLPLDDISRLIAKAQAFAKQEKVARKSESEEESSESSSDESEGEKERKRREEEEENAEGEEEASAEERASSSSSDEEKPPLPSEEMNMPWMNPDVKPIDRMDGIQELHEKKEEEENEKSRDEDEEDEEDDDIIVKPPPHARFLQRKASIASINMDRVCREKQHLEDEVASLSKYLNRSISRRRHSTVEMPKPPSMGAMKTLNSLLHKSDTELKESNAKIARLQEINADYEERIKDSEMMQDDLRQAVVIANNMAMEEREKNEALEEEREELLKQLEVLKKENARLRGKKSKGRAYKSRLGAEDDGGDSGGEIEPDFFSSRHSSIASLASEGSRGSDPDLAESSVK